MKIIGLTLIAVAGLLLTQRPRPPVTLVSLDVDGDGRADRVRLAPHGDALWLDVELAGAGFELASTTRVADGASLAGFQLAAAGRDVIVRDGRGRTSVWRADGLGFAQAPVASSTTE